jgi:hypothetical protein
MWDGEEHVWITNGSRGGRWAKSSSLPAIEQQSRRWIEHLQNRIAYEKAIVALYLTCRQDFVCFQ